MKYRRKPLEVDVFKVSEYEYNNFLMLGHFSNPPWWLEDATAERQIYSKGRAIYIESLNISMQVFTGDYIVRETDGNLYRCKPSIFEETYEKVEKVKGKWLFVHPLQNDDPGAYICSICQYGNWDIKPTDKECPHCGAEMDVNDNPEDMEKYDNDEQQYVYNGSS